jgi:hypothetical protein
MMRAAYLPVSLGINSKQVTCFFRHKSPFLRQVMEHKIDHKIDHKIEPKIKHKFRHKIVLL